MRGEQTSGRADEKSFSCRLRILFLSGLLVCSSTRLLNAANILITHDACANAVDATPAPDLAYKPGVDVNGNAVAPADLAGGAPPIQPPDTIKIPLQINLQNALHIPNNSSLTSPQAIAGTIEYKNGQVTFNGQPVSADAQAQIQAACDASKPSGPVLGKHSKNLLMGE